MNHRLIPALSILTALAIPTTLLCQNRYLQHNLVSDLPGLADHLDPNLVNPWGIAASSTSPFWIADNHSGLATVYDSSGKAAPLVVTVPTASGAGHAAVTGQVFNGGSVFVLQGAKPAAFLYCTEDGTISGWYNGIENNRAVVAVNRSGAGAVYKGLALGTSDAGPVIYAANFGSGAIDVFGGDFAPLTLAGSFADPALPAGFAPFNVYVTGGRVYVAYAKQDDEKEDDVPGNGNGFIDVFDGNGRLTQRLVSGGHLNSPWGMVTARENFGDFSNALLVGNFGDGTINAYNPSTGAFLGTMQDTQGKPIVTPGLWGLQFGNGNAAGDTFALYFTAGISGPEGDAIESHGVFGSIQSAPILRVGQVLNAAGFQKTIAPYTWVAIIGNNLAATTRQWASADFADNRLPTQLDGVSVTVGGKPAYVSYISPSQVNILTPAGLGIGDLEVQTKSGGLISNTVTVRSEVVSPALFKASEKYAVAARLDGSLVDTKKPAQPGEVIVLYGNGFGGTDPSIIEGAIVTFPAAIMRPVEVVIGGRTAETIFQGLTATGLYQFNVKVPTGLPAGDATIVVQSAGVLTPDGVFLPVDASPGATADSVASIGNFQFTPDPINLTTGGKLIWTNKDGVEHTVVSDTGQFRSQVLAQNDTFSVTLTTPGTYAYHCSIHPFMKGQIVVK
ncbi:MAG: TIGR03118 family protein [Candidatus Solibacter sp.]